MKTLSETDLEEALELCKLSGRMMEKRMIKTAAAIEPFLQSGWKGTYKQLADLVGSSENATFHCVQNYASQHADWPRLNVTQ